MPAPRNAPGPRAESVTEQYELGLELLSKGFEKCVAGATSTNDTYFTHLHSTQKSLDR